MSHEQQHRAQERQRQARAWRIGLAVSVVLHVLLFAVFGSQALPESPFAAAGERRGDDRAAVGGGMQAVQLRTPTSPEPVPPDPVPVPVEEVVEEVPEPEEEAVDPVPAIELALASSVQGNQGPAEGPGLQTGTGQGDGGTEAEGRFRVIPPRPRHFGAAVFPDRPDRVRGKEIEVWVFVTAEGDVVPDSTRLNPPSGDRKFDRRLRDYASEWLFEAARRDGKAVAEWFRYVLTL